ncbi:MAG: RNA polymerase factor sigma-54 [Alphaproteobacteria bacterium]
MALSPQLSLRQTASLVMTPQLQQAIKLLQLSNLELAAYVEQELEQNPLLERDEGVSDEEDEAANGAYETDPGAPETDSEVPDSMELFGSEVLPDQQDAPLDTDYENLWTDDRPADGMAGETQAFGGRDGGGFEESVYNLEQTIAKGTTLRDHLLAQLYIDIPDPSDRIIGVHLIDMIDEAGYLAGDLGEVAGLLNCGLGRVEATLGKLQRFDPAGILARSLAECLALQLRDLERLDPAMATLLDNLGLLASRDMAALQKVCGVDAEELAGKIEEIKALDPKPGLAFDQRVAQPVIPDIIVRPTPGGDWHVELNSETLPRVLVNHQYYVTARREARHKEGRDYLAERFQSANWLVRSLMQRANTMLKVATEIVRRQDAFLRHGVQHLRPMTLRDVARSIEMHASTVSRVTSNKYMAHPRGIYGLKYFFTAAIASRDGGTAHSAEAVRCRIKELIDKEKPSAVLSDEMIVDILNDEGVDIARRTVAKYREAMRVPASVRRRREKSGAIQRAGAADSSPERRLGGPRNGPRRGRPGDY